MTAAVYRFKNKWLLILEVVLGSVFTTEKRNWQLQMLKKVTMNAHQLLHKNSCLVQVLQNGIWTQCCLAIIHWLKCLEHCQDDCVYKNNTYKETACLRHWYGS
jgi:hypothetical protein